MDQEYSYDIVVNTLTNLDRYDLLWKGQHTNYFLCTIR